MKKIPTYVRGAIDYGLGGLMLSSPSTLGFPKNGWGRTLPRLIGAGMIGMSTLTDYEWGATRRIPMKQHLIADVGRGAFLATSPWLLGFKTKRKRSWLPHLLIGGAIAATALMTQTEPRRWRVWTRGIKKIAA
jgi:hypothetical protein